MPRSSSRNGSDASMAKRNWPAWRRSSSPIAFSMARRAAGGNARLTDQWSVKRCRNQRLKSTVVSPAAGGAASAEAASSTAEAAAAPAETASTEAASSGPSSAWPAAAGPTAATAAQSLDERDDESDQPPDDLEREHAPSQPADAAHDPSAHPAADDAAS